MFLVKQLLPNLPPVRTRVGQQPRPKQGSIEHPLIESIRCARVGFRVIQPIDSDVVSLIENRFEAIPSPTYRSLRSQHIFDTGQRPARQAPDHRSTAPSANREAAQTTQAWTPTASSACRCRRPLSLGNLDRQYPPVSARQRTEESRSSPAAPSVPVGASACERAAQGG